MTREELEKTLRLHHGCQDFRLPYGWLELCVELHGKLKAIDARYKVAQAKEKFGGLRYYLSFVYGMEEDMPTAEERDLMWKMVKEYEQRSFRTCQDCGEPAHMVKDHGRYKTACAAHGAK